MDVIALSFKFKDYKFDYCCFNEEVVLSNYYFDIVLPKESIVLNNIFEIKDWIKTDYKVLFIQPEFKKRFDSISNKPTYLINENKIIKKILDTTPIYLNKDSINQSLRILKLIKEIKNLEEVPYTLMEEYFKIKNIEKIKLLKTENPMCKISGSVFANNRIKIAIKKMPKKFCVNLISNFYSLGPLLRILSKLENYGLNHFEM